MTHVSAVVAVLWILLSPAAGGQHVADAQAALRVDGLLAEWDRPGAPGVAVAVMREGEVVYERRFGLASLEHGIPITGDTRFELASVSKQFTAFAVFLLEREGRLRLSDPITALLPELPSYADAIEIRHLVHHTSGLPEFLTVARLSGFGEMSVITFDDVLSMLRRWEGLYFTPGSKWHYTNTNYALLAEIVARITGEPFFAWMTEHVFEPLGMHHTLVRSNAVQVIPARAEGYHEHDGAFVVGREAMGDFPGAARVYSTIGDLLAWLEAFRGMRPGADEVMLKMVQCGTLRDGSEIDYAGGLYVWPYHGATAFSHSGVGSGFRTNVTYSPDVDVGVVILSNGGSLEPTQLGLRILDVYLGRDAEAATAMERAPARLAPEAHEGFPGRYVIEGAGIAAVIWRDGGSWLGAMEGAGVGSLYVVSPTELATDDDSVRVAFVPAAVGAAASPRMRVTVGGQQLWATKIVSTTAKDDGDYAGRYYSDELGTVYELAAADAGLRLRHRGVGDGPLHFLAADRLVGQIGILSFQRDDEGRVLGFTLNHELLPDRGVRFTRVGS